MSVRRHCRSWGGFPAVAQEALQARWGEEPLPEPGTGSLLTFGNGRSYGDCCLNPGGTLLDARPLDRTLEFDAERGVLRAEAGKTLAELLEEVVPRGWFPPVTPGTREVTLGGAVANDVHGKNHHRAGSIGCHVRSFELLRSDGSRLTCAPDRFPELFRATIGGMGLTGLIRQVELQLKPIDSSYLEMRTIAFQGLEEYLQLAPTLDREWEYTVAWIDTTARGAARGRGLLLVGRHQASAQRGQRLVAGGRSTLSVPFELPCSVLTGPVARLFNALYFHRGARAPAPRIVHFSAFFYPLDAIRHWNRLYGRRGFLQHQCVVPADAGAAALQEILDRVQAAGEGCLLAVLKRFGEHRSPGMLSFPRPGYTLALDFAFRGERTLRLLEALEGVVARAGGAIYPAKDASMRGEHFRQFFPRWREFQNYKDPGFSSALWRRVTGGA